MDVTSLAAATASIMRTYLTRVASGVSDPATDEHVDRLYQLVSSRLQSSRTGASSLERLQRQPNDAANEQAIALALADEADRDPRFAADITELLRTLPFAVAETSSGTSIANTGQLDNRRGVITGSGSTVDQSRRFKLGTGGIAAIVIGSVLLVGGTTAAVISATGTTYPAIEGEWRQESEGGAMTLRVTDDKWTADAVTIFGAFHCAGTVSRGPDDTYLFTTTDGACPRGTATLEENGHALVLKSSNDPDGDRFVR